MLVRLPLTTTEVFAVPVAIGTVKVRVATLAAGVHRATIEVVEDVLTVQVTAAAPESTPATDVTAPKVPPVMFQVTL